jgi:PD-(D/E)XK nuclease superfamily
MRLGWRLPVEHLSATALARFAECPESYRQRYLLKTADKMSAPRFQGIVNHRVHEQLFLSRRNNIPVSDLDGLYRQVWEDTLWSEGEPEWRDDPNAVAEIGLRMVRLYEERVAPTLAAVAVEERVECRVPGVPVPLIGYLDVVEADRIRERKTTGRKTVSPTPRWRFQALVYQFATGLPVQWDVITSQVTPQLYQAPEHPDLFLPVGDLSATRDLVYQLAVSLNATYESFGADRVWPTLGVFGAWTCKQCPVGPQYAATCRIWS